MKENRTNFVVGQTAYAATMQSIQVDADASGLPDKEKAVTKNSVYVFVRETVKVAGVGEGYVLLEDGRRFRAEPGESFTRDNGTIFCTVLSGTIFCTVLSSTEEQMNQMIKMTNVLTDLTIARLNDCITKEQYNKIIEILNY